MANKPGRRGFGSIRRLPSKRWQARYVGPDLSQHSAPSTFATKMAAEAWLGSEQALIASGGWSSPSARAAARLRKELQFGQFAEQWLRLRRLRPRTVEGYRHLLDRYLLPAFGDLELEGLTPARVRTWWGGLDPSTPTVNARAYTLLKGICATAVEDELLTSNPCRIRAASTTPRAKDIRPATIAELDIIAAAMPPSRRTLVLLSAWCALRRGEVLALRRRDVDLAAGTIRVERAVQWLGKDASVGPPKTSAGRRTVAIPPHVLPFVDAHMREHVRPGKDALLFTGADKASYLTPSALQGSWEKARLAAGREDLRLHDLRHTGATMAAMTGATLAELQQRLGHSSVVAALRYQHAVQGRDAEIAAALSVLAAAQQASAPKPRVGDAGQAVFE